MPYKDKEVNRVYQRLWRYRDHEATLMRAKKKREKYKKEGRCPSCSAKLVEGEKITCSNCSSRIFRWEMKYAKDSMRLAKII
jgi:DNA-directed RNA polymerase subunit RPC12/RpoP